MTTATKKRRRYVFKTRVEAEHAAERRARENGELMNALQALVNNKVTWLEPIRPAPPEERFYRFGYCHRRYETIVFESFHCPGQDTYTACYGEERLRNEIATYSYCPSNQAEGLARSRGLRAVAETIIKTRPMD